MTTQQDQFNDAYYRYEEERKRVTDSFESFWNTHSYTPTGLYCLTAGGVCSHAQPEDPESEEETARRVITEPIEGEPFFIAFGRWTRLLGKLEVAGDHDLDETMDAADPVCIVAWRFAVLAHYQQIGGTDSLDAEEKLDKLREQTEA